MFVVFLMLWEIVKEILIHDEPIQVSLLINLFYNIFPVSLFLFLILFYIQASVYLLLTRFNGYHVEKYFIFEIKLMIFVINFKNQEKKKNFIYAFKELNTVLGDHLYFIFFFVNLTAQKLFTRFQINLAHILLKITFIITNFPFLKLNILWKELGLIKIYFFLIFFNFKTFILVYLIIHLILNIFITDFKLRFFMF